MALNPTADIFWEGYGISTPGTGVGVFATRLLQALAKRNCVPKIIGQDRSGLAGTKPLTALFSLQEAIKHISAQTSGAPAIFHGLNNFNLPWLGPKHARTLRYVLTVHDIIPLIADSGVSRKFAAQFRFLFPKALKRADAIVCVSCWTKDKVLERFPEFAAKTQVIRLGGALRKNVKRPPSDGPLRLLSIGRNESYKRLDLLFEIASLSKGMVTIDLVTDKLGKHNLQQRLEKEGLGACFNIHTDLNQGDLDSLYQDAAVYVQPSLYEGFCLPAAEAMAFGLPVVYSEGSALSELVGSAGVSLERTASANQWVKAVHQAAELAKNAAWDGILSKSRAAQSSWDDCALSYLNLYAKLLEQ